MANLTQVLFGNRLFGAVTYSENYDPQTFAVPLSETQATVDVDAIEAKVPLADTQSSSDSKTAVFGKVFSETQASVDAKTFNGTQHFTDSLLPADQNVAVRMNKGFSEFFILQEWIQIKLIRANVWSSPSATSVTQTLYGRPLFGQRLFSATPGTIWTKDTTRQRNWTNLDGENNQEA